jgi:hypothetical protein
MIPIKRKGLVVRISISLVLEEYPETLETPGLPMAVFPSCHCSRHDPSSSLLLAIPGLIPDFCFRSSHLATRYYQLVA